MSEEKIEKKEEKIVFKTPAQFGNSLSDLCDYFMSLPVAGATSSTTSNKRLRNENEPETIGFANDEIPDSLDLTEAQGPKYRRTDSYNDPEGSSDASEPESSDDENNPSADAIEENGYDHGDVSDDSEAKDLSYYDEDAYENWEGDESEDDDDEEEGEKSTDGSEEEESVADTDSDSPSDSYIMRMLSRHILDEYAETGDEDTLLRGLAISSLVENSDVNSDSDTSATESLNNALIKAIQKENIEEVEELLRAGAEEDIGATEALHNNSAVMLEFFEVDADETDIQIAVANRYHEALDYFLAKDFEFSSQLVLDLAIEQNYDGELVAIVCQNAEIDHAYDLIQFLIENDGDILIADVVESFEIEDLLLSLREKSAASSVFKRTLHYARIFLATKKGLSEQQIDLHLADFDPQIKVKTILLSYPRDAFAGDPKLQLWRDKISAMPGLAKETKSAANLIGAPLSTTRPYLTTSTYHPSDLKESGKYIRSSEHPWHRWISARIKENQEKISRKERSGVVEAYLGEPENPFDRLLPPAVMRSSALTQVENKTARKQPANFPKTEGQLYDLLLLTRKNTCQYIQDQCHFDEKAAIKVGYYNEYPCIMVFMHPLSTTENATDTALKAWTEVLMSYFLALVNYTAQQKGFAIEMLRRSSFGFLTPTIAECGRSFRINVGIIPREYAQVLINSLGVLNGTLLILRDRNFSSPGIDIRLPKRIFLDDPQYESYLNDRRLPKEKKSADRIPERNRVKRPSIKDLLDFISIKVEKGPQGKTALANMTRSAFGRDALNAEIYKLLHSLSNGASATISLATQAFLGGLRWGLERIRVEPKGSQLKLSFDQSGDINFARIQNPPAKVADSDFFKSIKSIISAMESAQNISSSGLALFPETHPLSHVKKSVIEELQKIHRLICSQSIAGLYPRLEMLHELIYIQTLLSSGEDVAPEEEYGSDSDIELEPSEATKRAGHTLYGKKIIARNGMKAVSASILAISSYLESSKENAPLQCYLKDAYYEINNVIKHFKKTKKKIKLLKSATKADLLFYDANACITDGNITREVSDRELANIRILIIDSTSASIGQHHTWVARFHQYPNIQLLLFVSSGFKNEQMGADKNPYGTIRIFAKHKGHLEKFLTAIKLQKNISIRSALSHSYRRLHKTILGNVPTNNAIVYFKKINPSLSINNSFVTINNSSSAPITSTASTVTLGDRKKKSTQPEKQAKTLTTTVTTTATTHVPISSTHGAVMPTAVSTQHATASSTTSVLTLLASVPTNATSANLSNIHERKNASKKTDKTASTAFELKETKSATRSSPLADTSFFPVRVNIKSKHTATVNKPSPSYWYEDSEMNRILELTVAQQNAHIADGRPIYVLGPLDNISRSYGLTKTLRDHARKPGVILIPFNLGGLHWVGLVLEYNPRGCLIKANYYDSLGRRMPAFLNDILRSRRLKGDTVSEFTPIRGAALIKQRNGHDCGPCTIENLLAQVRPPEIADLAPLQRRTNHLELLRTADPGFYANFSTRQQSNQSSFLHKMQSANKTKKTERLSSSEYEALLTLALQILQLPSAIGTPLKNALQPLGIAAGKNDVIASGEEHTIQIARIRIALADHFTNPEVKPVIEQFFYLKKDTTSLAIASLRLDYNQLAPLAMMLGFPINLLTADLKAIKPYLMRHATVTSPDAITSITSLSLS
jgi:hypothetical protein